jgi:hypothetical protein
MHTQALPNPFFPMFWTFDHQKALYTQKESKAHKERECAHPSFVYMFSMESKYMSWWL